tara:strand:+ start:15541 stop:16590 length:1050 start_codon:yes stop_codon:yes gene_type:complete
MSKDIRISAVDLNSFTKEVFISVGLPPEDAEIEAELLVWANLRGIDSHGVLRIPFYIDAVEKGLMNPNPNIEVLNETSATVMYEADRAFGPVVTTRVMKHVISKAKDSGICWGLIKDTTHQGAMAYYSLMAAEASMAGIAIVCSPPNMAIHGSKSPGAHNSPISIAVPAMKENHLVLDMATSVAAAGKISVAKDKGISIPSDWALDSTGVPTTDPSLATILLPAGGPKGSGLALMFESLSSIMAGNPLLAPNLTGKQAERRIIQNSIVVAIDISAFTDIAKYRLNIDDLVKNLKTLPKAEGVEEIFVPGEPESRVYKDRSKNGIPVPLGTLSNLEVVSKKLGTVMPKIL